MGTTSAVLFTSFAIQAVGSLLTAAVLGSFYRHYQHSYLLQWTRSWLAASMMLSVAAAALVLSPHVPELHPLQVTTALLSSTAGYLQIAFLLLGTRELITKSPVPARVRRLVILLGSLIGVLVALLFLWDSSADALRLFTRYGLRALFAGLAFLGAAWLIWRANLRREGTGHRLLIGGFAVYGLQQLHLFGTAVYGLVNLRLPAYVFHLGAYDLVVQFAMALGMVIWLLEDERKATLDAASQIEHLAYHDALTGLPNRQLFLDRLETALPHAHRAGHQLAVFFLDLDRFKLINDSLGHGVGDRLLQQVAQRIRTLLRAEDTVTRLGGDEFTILAPKLRGADDAIAVARKIRDSVKTPFVIDGRELFVTTSIGISMYPNDGENADTLLRNADSAMYRAKEQGRDVFQLYTASMNARALEQLALENSLRRAAVNQEFVLHYQPVLDMESSRICAMETVLRWRHPELGLVYPENFLPLSETTGLIVPIGEWVLRTACEQVKTWREMGHSDLRAAINISVRELQQPDFVELVSQILTGTHLPGSALEFEITESVAMQSDRSVVDKLRELKRLGIRISIDDFGTGYSSLGALRLFPVDALKIDRSFVRGITLTPDDVAIASAIIALAHSLRLTVIAEGVETPGQLEFLRTHGCDAWQGFLFGRAVPAEECEAVLARGRGGVEAVLPVPQRGQRV